MLLMANLEKVQDKVLFSVLITKLTPVRIFPFFSFPGYKILWEDAL